MLVVKGDWIIKGVKGEFYPCNPDVFAATYVAEESGMNAEIATYDWQDVMMRLEDRLNLYTREAERYRGGTKKFTLSQLKSAKAHAMREARLIVWIFLDENQGQPKSLEINPA